LIVVIASEAKQSMLNKTGLLRRFAPRNDGKIPTKSAPGKTGRAFSCSNRFKP
jgi:hypothetical protein